MKNTALSLTQAISHIEKENKRNNYWTAKTTVMTCPIPNMSRRSLDTPRTQEIAVDEFAIKKIDEEFFEVILQCLARKKVCLYVHDSKCCFYPVFGILYKPSSFHNRKNRYIFKYTEKNCSKEMYKKLVEHLYSKKNTFKHTIFGLKKIEELSQYEY